jgi:nitrate reductase gamma subunit
MIQYLNVFFYDIYPYLCGTVFLVGSWLRYDYGQYTWRASSSQMLDKRGMVLWSNCSISAFWGSSSATCSGC